MERPQSAANINIQKHRQGNHSIMSSSIDLHGHATLSIHQVTSQFEQNQRSACTTTNQASRLH
jgi:hypothetical protein